MACADGRIVDVGPAAQVEGRHPSAPVRDLGDVLLLPGLVDAHCHLEWSLLGDLLPRATFGRWLGRFLPLRLRMLPEDHLAAARAGALAALLAGTTTLADSGPTGAGVDAMTEAGLRGTVHLEAFGREQGAAARRAAAAHADRVAALDGGAGPRVRVGVSPHAPYTVGPDLWRALAEHPGLAARPWATHVAESEDEERCIARGEGPLADVFAAGGLEPGRWGGAGDEGPVGRLARGGALRAGTIAAHCVRLAAGDPATLRDARVPVAHCPRSNGYLRCGRAPLERLRAAGALVALGTDSPASGGDYDLRAEARAAAAAHAGVAGAPAADDLLRMATIDGARALGMAGEVGELSPGARADLLALRPARPVEDVAAAALDARAEVAMVALDGEALVEEGVALRLDAARVRARAREARARLC
ncbi:MAG: amidohydrolase family protein [Thermoleophilia bacterium]